MSKNKRPLFRESAWQQYMRRKEKDVLPRVLAPPVLLFCWIFLAILIVSGIVAWSQEVPIYASGTGILLPSESTPAGVGEQTVPTLILFLPARYAEQLRAGEPCHVRLADSAEYLPCSITSVSPEPLRSDSIQARYPIDSSSLPRMTRPVLVAEARIQQPLVEGAHIDERLKVRVQVERRRLLTLLPGFTSLEEGA